METKAVALNSIGLGDFEEGKLPQRILLLPAGQIEGRDGRKWLNSGMLYSGRLHGPLSGALNCVVEPATAVMPGSLSWRVANASDAACSAVRVTTFEARMRAW